MQQRHRIAAWADTWQIEMECASQVHNGHTLQFLFTLLVGDVEHWKERVPSVQCRRCSVGRNHKSLLHELHSLLRVMLSGTISTVVSPHNMLYTVWNIIPFFRGYSQQDAQEFLSYAASYFYSVCLPLYSVTTFFRLFYNQDPRAWWCSGYGVGLSAAGRCIAM